MAAFLSSIDPGKVAAQQRIETLAKSITPYNPRTADYSKYMTFMRQVAAACEDLNIDRVLAASSAPTLNSIRAINPNASSEQLGIMYNKAKEQWNSDITIMFTLVKQALIIDGPRAESEESYIKAKFCKDGSKDGKSLLRYIDSKATDLLEQAKQANLRAAFVPSMLPADVNLAQLTLTSQTRFQAWNLLEQTRGQ